MSKPTKQIKIAIAALIFLLAVVIIIGGYFYFKQRKQTTSFPIYYAVFLDNNQTFYGQLKDKEKPFVFLTDIYYIQTTKEENKSEAKANFSVVKFAAGNEAYGPKDEMYINKDHILKFEPLKEDSEVVKLIKEYKNKK